MKINNLTFILLLGVIISGLMFTGYVSLHGEKGISSIESQNKAQANENYSAASISKGTILFLLVAGIIGFLGVGRKKSDIVSPAQKNKINSPNEHQNMNAGRQEPVGKKS